MLHVFSSIFAIFPCAARWVAPGLAGMLASMLVLAGCQPIAPVEHDVYLWQREWTPALERTMRESRGWAARTRLLVAHWSAAGQPSTMQIGRAATHLRGREAVVVVWMEGLPDPVALTAHMQSQLLRLKRAGVRVVAVEIAHHADTSRLATYADWLAALGDKRTWLDKPLWITALPGWRHSPVLPRLLSLADRYTLQFHLPDGDGTWTDMAQMRIWMEAFAERSSTPFHVSLPMCASQAEWDAADMNHPGEAESPSSIRPRNLRHPDATHGQLHDWLASLDTWRSPRFRGIVWYHAPPGNDGQVLSSGTRSAPVCPESPGALAPQGIV